MRLRTQGVALVFLIGVLSALLIVAACNTSSHKTEGILVVDFCHRFLYGFSQIRKVIKDLFLPCRENGNVVV